MLRRASAEAEIDVEIQSTRVSMSDSESVPGTPLTYASGDVGRADGGRRTSVAGPLVLPSSFAKASADSSTRSSMADQSGRASLGYGGDDDTAFLEMVVTVFAD